MCLVHTVTDFCLSGQQIGSIQMIKTIIVFLPVVDSGSGFYKFQDV